MLDSR